VDISWFISLKIIVHFSFEVEVYKQNYTPTYRLLAKLKPGCILDYFTLGAFKEGHLSTTLALYQVVLHHLYYMGYSQV